MTRYLRRAESEKGNAVFSEVLSRTLQRKLVSLMCFQFVEEEGRSRVLKTSRLIAERIMMELLLSQQNSCSVSTHLWTAVRARGCQFLGPAMQEDVLKLILLALNKGALIARKALVMYVVQILAEDYPQMALECGLRISPDQWSALLYGDQSHRSHMQSIIDRLQTPKSYMQDVDELISVSNETDSMTTACDLAQITQLLRHFDSLSIHHERVSWQRFAEYIGALYKLIKSHAELGIKRNEQCVCKGRRPSLLRPIAHLKSAVVYKAYTYKTKMCRDISARRLCPRGARCTYAHSTAELRNGSRRNVTSCFQQSNNGHLATQRVMVPSAIYPTGINGTYHIDSSLTSVTPPSLTHPTIVPIVPVPLMISPHAHHSMSQVPSTHASPQVVMLPPGISHQGMVLSNPRPYPQSSGAFHLSPQPSSLCNTHPPGVPDAVLVHHLNSPPSQSPHQIWVHTSPAVYSFDTTPDNGFVWSSPCRPELTVPPPSVQSSRLGDQSLDTEQLMMKRNEVINRFVPLTLLDEDEFEDGGVGHVSYTVASSVLDERGELHPVALMVGPQALELPPIPAANLSTIPLPTTVADGTV
ncbi:unnamed protein product [Angiostrongylus costaricensis]|uniref:RING-type E3 ubiquitin transferase n=1 Tax=Angiostrongylus costaricensis TaxID=334426 RepID=A0A0R3PJH2_ANGCS|nr:unnamed protein product [Angiostrongylus costaricensis]